MDLIFQWIDLIWVVVIPLAVARRHWLVALGYVLSCVLVLRMQVELMDIIGYSRGFLPFLDVDVFTRGLVVYGVIMLVYFPWAYYLRRSSAILFMAHSIAMFFIALCASMLVMVL